MTTRHHSQRGAISGSLIAIVLLTVAILALGALSVWLYTNYTAAKTNIDGKVQTAVADAKKKQADEDDAKFVQREKEPNRTFVGPDDYGRVSFSYPKTWSAYVATDVTQGGDYDAYLNPVYVPPVGSSTQRFALRLVIQNQAYSNVLSNYDGLVKGGQLKSSPVTINNQTATRFDGSFSQDIRGSAVIFKLRDKTVSFFTDANTFKPDFDKIIKTIKFNS